MGGMACYKPGQRSRLTYAPGEKQPTEVFFDGTQTLPFAVLQQLMAIVAAQLVSTGS